ncbi:OmpP1/FadL family transporter [Thermodesulfovibrio sp. N1]|uniref:OmpP1/FadL family transporter n=1 Tax=Thermodesulfovibrio sp. N1 TaxID=1871110 RepID=UPI00083B634D|nr:OmpP1/FadL family transporter [Thermodesulfovibrio sp. N1]
MEYYFYFCFFLNVSNTYGSGFAIYTQSSSSLGQSAATIAHTEDASAIFFNPALINKLEGTQIQIGTTLMFPNRKFTSDYSGKTYKEETDLHFPSTFYMTHKFNEKVSVGLGVFSPFGLGTKWPDDWEGRYITTKADMKTYNINPVISLQITPDISLAGGLNILYLDTTLEKKLNFSPLPDGNQKFKGDGMGFGCNFGVLVDLTKDLSIGASYRSRIKVDIDGSLTHNLPSPLLSDLFPNTNGKVQLTLPAQFHFGVFYKGLDPFTFEIAMRWEGWSSYKELKLDLEQPIFYSNTLITPKNWKDTYSFNVGIKYQINETLALLAGYLYSGNPVPDSTFEPTIPDANTHLLTAGILIKKKNFNFDISYAYQKLQNRKKNNTIDDNPLDVSFNANYSANGTYKSDIHMIGLSLTYKF